VPTGERYTSTWFLDYMEGTLATATVPIESQSLADYTSCWGIPTGSLTLGQGDLNDDGVTTQACANVVLAEAPDRTLDPNSPQVAVEGSTTREAPSRQSGSTPRPTLIAATPPP